MILKEFINLFHDENTYLEIVLPDQDFGDIYKISDKSLKSLYYTEISSVLLSEEGDFDPRRLIIFMNENEISKKKNDNKMYCKPMSPATSKRIKLAKIELKKLFKEDPELTSREAVKMLNICASTFYKLKREIASENLGDIDSVYNQVDNDEDEGFMRIEEEKEKLRKLLERDPSIKATKACQLIGISPTTFYRWRNEIYSKKK